MSTNENRFLVNLLHQSLLLFMALDMDVVSAVDVPKIAGQPKYYSLVGVDFVGGGETEEEQSQLKTVIFYITYCGGVEQWCAVSETEFGCIYDMFEVHTPRPKDSIHKCTDYYMSIDPLPEYHIGTDFVKLTIPEEFDPYDPIHYTTPQ